MWEGPAYDLKSFFTVRSRPRLGIVPDFYVVCGDIASTQASDFDSFLDWASQLPLDDGVEWRERVYVVPGNHDNLFTPDGNDGLTTFHTKIARQGVRTPFGLEGRNDCLHQCDGEGCSAAIFWHPDHGVAFLLLTTSFYTGQVSRDMQAHLEKLGVQTKDYVSSRIERERGYVSDRYREVVEDLLDRWKEIVHDDVRAYRKLAVAHHNMHGTPAADDGTSHGIQLLAVLKSHGFDFLLHGHTHEVGDVLADTGNELAVPVGCGALAAKHLGDDGNSLNVLQFDESLSAAAYFTRRRMFNVNTRRDIRLPPLAATG
jgi:predicted phosphodiesterase